MGKSTYSEVKKLKTIQKKNRPRGRPRKFPEEITVIKEKMEFVKKVEELKVEGTKRESTKRGGTLRYIFDSHQKDGDLEDRMLRDRIILGVNDDNLQKRLMEVETLALDKAIEMARASELSRQQSRTLQRAAPGSSLTALQMDEMDEIAAVRKEYKSKNQDSSKRKQFTNKNLGFQNFNKDFKNFRRKQYSSGEN